MPKRKVQDDEEGEVEDNAHQSASEGEVVKKSKQSSATSAKPKAQSSKKKKKGTTTADGDIQANDEGDKYVDLGRNRRATVHVFKGIPLIDIREYFDSGGEQKPGKKGISLKLEEWQALKQNVDAIDGILSDVKTKE